MDLPRFQSDLCALSKEESLVIWDLNVCKVFESTTNWIMGSGI